MELLFQVKVHVSKQRLENSDFLNYASVTFFRINKKLKRTPKSDKVKGDETKL